MSTSGYEDGQDIEIIEETHSSVSPAPKRSRGRPVIREETDDEPLTDTYSSVFGIEFRPTRVKGIERREIFEHFRPLAAELVVAKCKDEFGVDVARTPFYFKLFLRTKKDTEEMLRHNSQPGVLCSRIPRWTNKLKRSHINDYFENLNVWPENTPEAERDDDNPRHEGCIRIDIGKKASQYIDYASNSDGDLLFMGLTANMLNIHWKMTNWARHKYETKTEFDITEPFVTEGMQIIMLIYMKK